jgi:hypothetical protein
VTLVRVYPSREKRIAPRWFAQWNTAGGNVMNIPLWLDTSHHSQAEAEAWTLANPPSWTGQR